MNSAHVFTVPPLLPSFPYLNPSALTRSPRVLVIVSRFSSESEILPNLKSEISSGFDSSRSHSRRPLTVEPTLVFISALQIKALLILAASLPRIDYLVICPRPTIQGFLPNAGLQVVCGEQVLETVITYLSP